MTAELLTPIEITSDKRQAIVTAALALFAEKTYDAVTVKEIADRACVSLTTFYRYFKTKRDLLLEVSLPRIVALIQRLNTSLNAQTDPVEKILVGVREAFMTIGTDELLAALVTLPPNDPVIEQGFERVVRLCDALSFSMFKSAHESELSWMKDVPAVTAIVKSLVLGWFSVERQWATGVELPRVVAALEQILRRALRPGALSSPPELRIVPA